MDIKRSGARSRSPARGSHRCGTTRAPPAARSPTPRSRSPTPWAPRPWSRSPRPVTPAGAWRGCTRASGSSCSRPTRTSRRQMALLWGVEGYTVWTVRTTDEMVRQVDSGLVQRGVSHPGDLVVIIAGTPPTTPGATNTIRVHHIGDVQRTVTRRERTAGAPAAPAGSDTGRRRPAVARCPGPVARHRVARRRRVPGREPRDVPAACVRRAGRGAGAGGRRSHRRPRRDTCTRCTRTSSGPATPRPILYLVENVRDGRSFSVRRVSAQQHGKTIFTLSASFQLPQPGSSTAPRYPTSPARTRCRRCPSCWPAVRPRRGSSRCRTRSTCGTSTPPWLDDAPREQHRLWLKAKGTLPDDPLLHVCVATFASDFSLLEASLVRQGRSWDRDEVVGASLDHAMWFHRPFRADEWLLYDTASPSALRVVADSTRGGCSPRTGEHAVTVLQEGMLRVR